MRDDSQKEHEHDTKSRPGHRLRSEHRERLCRLGFADAEEMLAKARIVAQIGRIIQAWKPVSYTHLDVYKRQILRT